MIQYKIIFDLQYDGYKKRVSDIACQHLEHISASLSLVLKLWALYMMLLGQCAMDPSTGFLDDD